jgi:hypothetical protein
MGVKFLFCKVVHKSHAESTKLADAGTVEAHVTWRRAAEPEELLEFVQEQLAIETA